MADEHAEKLVLQAQDFQARQADIESRLQSITQSSVSDDAVKEFEGRMLQVRRLDIATGYLETLQEVHRLCEHARATLKTNPKECLADHQQLRSLLQLIKDAQAAAEGAAPHLLDFVEHESDSLYTDIKADLESTLQKTLDTVGWPKKELKLYGDLVSRLTNQIEHLLELQEPDLIQISSQRGLNADPVVLLPLEVMVRPLSIRFRYHFYGDRPTNRLDKPEYFLNHILDILDQQSSIVTSLLQPILDEHIHRTEKLEYLLPDAASAFITALLPMVTAKCLSILTQISSQPQLLSHFIDELMKFDNVLRESWTYSPSGGPFSEWKGLTWTILTKHAFFDTWLTAEKEFAISRYKSIRDAPDSNQIDFDALEAGKTKPTKGAIRINDLLETITDRYRGLSSFSQKIKFLINIQLDIFDDYHSHLHGAFQAYLATSHTAGRLIQGGTEADAFGLKGLESLCKIYGSAEYLERKMGDWSDDIFFLELWDELRDRARRNTQGNGSIGSNLKVDDVAAKTSASIKQDGMSTSAEDNDPDSGGALFDETSSSFRRLRERSEAEIIRVLDINIRNATKTYTGRGAWSTVSTSTSEPDLDISSLSPSATLDTLLNTLTSHLTFLSRVLAFAPRKRIAKAACNTVQRDIYDNLIMRHSFSLGGAAQLRRDLSSIEACVDAAVELSGEGRRCLSRLRDASLLLNLVGGDEGSSTGIDASTDDSEGWGFDDDADTGTGLENQDQTQPDISKPTEGKDSGIPSLSDSITSDVEKTHTLWDVERQLFLSNESARRILSELGIDSLSETEARNVLKKRVELSGA